MSKMNKLTITLSDEWLEIMDSLKEMFPGDTESKIVEMALARLYSGIAFAPNSELHMLNSMIERLEK